MNINKKFIVLGLVLLSLCWIGNAIYYNNKVLNAPLFIKHYYDVPVGMNEFRLYYIQNLYSQDKAVSVKFPEVGQDDIYVTENDYNSDKRYYTLKFITVNIYNGDTNNIPDKYKNKVITKAQIKFSNGKTMNVNLGKIYLYSDEIENKNLNCQRQSSSSDNTGDFFFTVNKDISLTGIDSKFSEAIKEIFQININGKLISDISFPIKLVKGDTIDINYKFNYDKNGIKRNNAYNFSFNILSEDLQGNKGSTPCFINTDFQSPEDFDIDALKKGSD